MTSCVQKNRVVNGNNFVSKKKIIFNSPEYDLQFFDFKGNEGAEIVGSHGTRLTFPPNCFVDPEGNVITDSIHIHLKEYFLTGEEQSSSTPMVSENYSLLSNGAFELVAFFDTSELTFHPSVDIDAITLD